MKTLQILVCLTLISSSAFSQILDKKAPSFEYNGEKHVFKSSSRKTDLPQQEITSKMHGENIGKIVFSNDKIAFQNEDPSKIKSVLKTSDNIYGRAYMLCSPANDTVREQGTSSFYKSKIDYMRLAKKIEVVQVIRGADSERSSEGYYKLYIDGELSSFGIERINFSEESMNHTTRQVWIAPKLEDEKVSRFWLEIVDGLSPGEHSVRVELIGTYGAYESYRPLAAGEFTLIKDGAVASGVKFADLKEAKVDDALAKQIVPILNETYKKKGWDGTVEKVKFMTDWESEYVDSNGGFKKIRQIWVYAYATYPGEPDKCTVEQFAIAQSHNGSEFSGPLFHRSVVPSSKERVDCD